MLYIAPDGLSAPHKYPLWMAVRDRTTTAIRGAARWAASTALAAWLHARCVEFFAYYERQSARVARWRMLHPLLSRWAIDAPIGVLSAAVFYADVTSDALIAAELAGSIRHRLDQPTVQ